MLRHAGKRLGVCLLGTALTMQAAAATQGAPPARQAPAEPAAAVDIWGSVGAGYYDGEDYAPPPGGTKSDAQKVGGWEGYAALTFGSRAAARLRAAWMADYTSNTAEEVAAEIGMALYSTKAYLFAGASRLTDVANDRQRPIVGVPVELLFYPTRGLELGVHGNLNSQSDFIGVTLGGVFGKNRAR
ncbi:hypothetical protein [Solimonas soli]|uniref:hypothetical protein n=1 Tax=Solimonas soli TaxID=413479 RepID=UPI000480E75D|nr:hypothetical protein [Solimonas soli]